MSTVFVRAPWSFALRMSRMSRDMLCKVRRVAILNLRRSWLDVLVKACNRHLYSSWTVHHGGRRVAECGHVASEIGGVVVLRTYELVYVFVLSYTPYFHIVE